ncbi:MAG: cyclic nucleotide-binding domain-containing protein [Alphaproteobacteria bacterium]|nr:cyclic nucleotide-binding domain-containing protein [Alphaproteobacteria bacterium]
MSFTDVLRGSALFDELSDQEIELLARVMVEHAFPRGHVFMAEGDRATNTGEAAFLVVEGQVVVTQNTQSGPHEVGRLGPGDFFGLVALVDDGARSATCAAATDVRAAGLTRQAFELLHRQDLGLATRFQYLVARQLARNVRAATAALSELITE